MYPEFKEKTIEPRHEKTCLCHMRTTKAQISLISAFVVHCLGNIIPLVSIGKISSLYLVSMSAQAGLSLAWLQTPKIGFFVTRLSCFPLHWGIIFPVKKAIPVVGHNNPLIMLMAKLCHLCLCKAKFCYSTALNVIKSCSSKYLLHLKMKSAYVPCKIIMHVWCLLYFNKLTKIMQCERLCADTNSGWS